MISRTTLYALLRHARALSLLIALGFVLCAILALPNAVAAPMHAHAAPQDTQNTQELAEFVADFVRAATQTTHGDALQIHVETVRRKLPACADLHAAMPKVVRARSTIAVRCTDPKPWNLMVPVQLRLPGAQMTATRTLSPGETVTQDDVRAVAADVLRLPADAVTDPTQALGRVVTQRIRQGSAIKSGALRDPAAIARGQRVQTEARGAGFVMRGTGHALQAGTPGRMIQVRTASGAVVSAIVMDAATVQVPL